MQFATTLKKNNKEKEKFDLISNAVASHPRKNGFISHVRHSLINWPFSRDYFNGWDAL